MREARLGPVRLSEQSVRGTAASLVTGALGAALAVVGETHMGLGPVLSSFLFVGVLGNVLGYAADILFAKATFSTGGGEPRAVPYGALGTRAAWLAGSLGSRVFVRFLTLVGIDGIIVSTMLQALIDAADRLGARFTGRNALMGLGVSAFTFLMYVNSLRFHWAYSTREDVLMNALVMMWFTLCLMLFVVIRTVRGKNQGQEAAPPVPAGAGAGGTTPR